MSEKVICPVLVYNGRTYLKGDTLEVKSDTELEVLIRERCVEKPIEKKGAARVRGGIKSRDVARGK